MSNSLLSVRILEAGKLINKIAFNEEPETDKQVKYMGVIKIGRMSTSHINLENPLISRMHAIVEHIDNDFFITLMGIEETSLNGTVLQRNVKTKLNNKDVLTVGNLSIKFFINIDVNLIEEPKEIKIPTIPSKAKLQDTENNEVTTIGAVVPPLEMLQGHETSEKIMENKKSAGRDVYFNNNVDSPETLKKSIGKGIEIKHYWNNTLIDSKLFSKKSDTVTLGSEDNDTFFIDKELLPNKNSFNIMQGIGKIYFLPNNVKYIEGDDIYDLDELIQAQKIRLENNIGIIQLLFNTKIAFEIGYNRFEVSHVPLYKTAGKSILAPILDGLNIKFSTLSTILHLLLMFVVYLIPPELETFNIEKLNKIPERYAKVILDVPKIEKKKKKVEFKKVVKNSNVAFNKNFDPNASGFQFRSKDAGKQLTQRQIETKKLVHSKGILGLKGRLGSSGIGGGGGSYGGFEDENIRLVANDTDISSSVSGTPGIRGGGSGAGGMGTSLGTGGASTSGGVAAAYRGGGGFKGSGLGIKGKRKVSRKLKVRIKDDMITGNLTRQQIQRVVNRNIDQIRYCYEKQLLTKPMLKGNVTILWKINPQGRVVFVKITGATLKDKTVHFCMSQRIKKWRFPEPKGGGYAQVRYPFNFRSN